MHPIVGEVPIRKNPCVPPRTTWHSPAMNLFSIVVYQANNARTGKMGEESEAGGDAVVVNSSQAHAATMQCALLHISTRSPTRPEVDLFFFCQTTLPFIPSYLRWARDEDDGGAGLVVNDVGSFGKMSCKNS